MVSDTGRAPRVLISPGDKDDSSITISDPRELHHLRDVLRVRVGESLECFDGTGHGYEGRITRCTSRKIEVAIASHREEGPSLLTVTLAQALIKPERFDWVIQKATELGADRIIPLITHRSVVRAVPNRATNKLTRWQRISREAATQCGRGTLPTIESPQPMDRALASMPRVPLILIPTLAVTAVPLREALDAAPNIRQATVLIGPEGDFTGEEVALAQAHGAQPVSLGRPTLRSETAALAMLAMLSYALTPA